MNLENLKMFLYKARHWEYWPVHLVYFPIYLLWAYYAIRARSLFFFNAVNPAIKNGGFVMESKMDIYGLIPSEHYPTTRFVERNLPKASLKELLREAAIDFPLFVKPDIGLRGSGVRKITDWDHLYDYHQKVEFDYLIQALIDLPNEVGIFYIRHPKEPKGRITGMVYKELMTVLGDGNTSLKKLILGNPRYRLQLRALQSEYGEKLQEVLPKGIYFNLVPCGSHCRGAKFMDHSQYITPELTDTIDAICSRIEGFHYGRLDIMYRTMEGLSQGRDFKIVEINGAKSEPTHIYDPQHSLFFAWKELAWHIHKLYRISIYNHRHQNVPYLSFKNGMAQMREHYGQARKIGQFV
tara:strand:- start:15880 stop:16935 length:1056 start_codon:yes stop_codon:yes gene_type:complete